MSIVMRGMALVGLIQGLLLWALAQLIDEGIWPATEAPVLLALIYAAVALPFSWYLSENIDGLSPRRRRVIVLLLGLGMGVLGACEGWASAESSNMHVSVLACMALAFVALPLLVHARPTAQGRGFRLNRWQWNYADLFQTTWRNAMTLAVAALLTGTFWGVLFAGAFLMNSIGVQMVLSLIAHPLFSFPVTGIVVACAVALALDRADTIVTLRRFWLSMNQAFLPLVLLFAVMWVIALPFTGLAPLLETRMAGFALLWFAALAINFANAARQDGLGSPPFTDALRRALTYAWLAIPAVVGVAAYAIYLRIDQYGWSADRVWSVFVLVMAAGYTLGYALSVHQGERQGARSWMWSIDRTNVTMAIVLCVGLIALSSPLADARRIAVSSQVERLLAGKISIDTFDFYYLKSESGVYGTRALQALADGMSGHPQAALFAQAAREAQDGTLPDEDQIIAPPPSDDDVRKRWHLLAGQEAVPPLLVDTLLAHLRAQGHPMSAEDACLVGDTECLLWMADVDGDGKPELVLVVDQSWDQVAFVYQWQPAPAKLTLVGQIDGVTPEWIAGLSLGSVALPHSAWRDIEAAGVRLRIVPVTR